MILTINENSVKVEALESRIDAVCDLYGNGNPDIIYLHWIDDNTVDILIVPDSAKRIIKEMMDENTYY